MGTNAIGVMVMATDSVWPIQAKVGRLSDEESRLTPALLAAMAARVLDYLHDCTFPAVLVARDVERVLRGDAPASVVDGFRRRCRDLGRRAREVNREVERIAWPDDVRPRAA